MNVNKIFKTEGREKSPLAVLIDKCLLCLSSKKVANMKHLIQEQRYNISIMLQKGFSQT